MNINQTPGTFSHLLWTLCSLLASTRVSAANRRQTRRQPFPPRYVLDKVDAIREHAFVERNGLQPPPLTSRKLRRLEVNQTENQSNQTNLDSIIQDAKNGEDPNARLRADLIHDSQYDRNAYPWEYAWLGDARKNRTGVPVEMHITFHRVYSVETVNPMLDLIVWFRLEWVDPRLTWDPVEYGNHTKTWFWVDGNAGGETSEIWTPDIELWNLKDGLSSSLENAYAVVKYDGSVFWSRPGHLRPACKYSGLESFPFDMLSCTIELGSWSYSGMYLELKKGGGDNNGFDQGGSETAGESYNEFSFPENEPVTCELHTYNAAAWDNEHLYDQWGNPQDQTWPVLLYTVKLERSWQPYARGYIYNQVLISLSGFSAFWLPPSCGERMGLSITAMLASIASDIVIAGNLPQAKVLTWYQQFSMMNSMFIFLSLVESVIVLYFFYSRADDMVPKWYTHLKEWKPFHKARNRSSEMLAGARNSIRHTITSARDLPSSASNSNDVSGDGNEHQKRANPTSPNSAMVRDADDFLNEDEIQNNLRWKQISSVIDDFSRFWFPFTYAISFGIILSQAKYLSVESG